MRPFGSVFFGVLFAAWSSPSWGQTVSDAIAAEREGQLEAALDAFEDVLTAGGSSRRDLATIFEHLAVLRFAAGDEQGALEAFSRMLAVSPTASMPDAAPPDMQPLFDQAAERWRGHTLRAELEERGTEGGEVAVRVRVVDDLLDMVGGVRVTRGTEALASGTGYGPTWDLQIPIEALEGETPVVTVRLFDVYDSIIWEGTHEIEVPRESGRGSRTASRPVPQGGTSPNVRIQRIAAFAFIGVGLAVVAGGIALVAIDDRWTGETRVNDGMIEWKFHDTAAGGWVMIGLGGAAALGGMIWVLLTRRSGRSAGRVLRLSGDVVASW